MKTRPTAHVIAPETAWFKSSYSDPNQNCVEVAHPLPAGGIGVRDSKDPAGPALVLTPTTWSHFLTHVTASRS
ncbi:MULTISPECIES: DUF397 domain-containing protein [unclassified Streptomyces]|uniref:DUF397 domain-containing protein n=1 Tax=unclassified Streptomyces TaxID=2593676 RepID=UPI00278BC7BE|nr:MULTISPECIES: DUF397 domain-containing protein [unclassified Streptomyces]